VKIKRVPGYPKTDRKIILEVDSLSVVAQNRDEQTSILEGVSFQVEQGKVQSLIGPSGSGKTITALALLGLLPENLRRTGGKIIFNGRSVGKGQDVEFSKLRGRKITMIFQEAQASLNPVFQIGKQLTDVIRQNQRISQKYVRNQAINILAEVGFSDPLLLLHRYPHQLSGGMAQRVLIALALSCRPAILIADEPTTALDATTQIQVLKLLKRLQQKHQFAMLLISHDMKVVTAMSDSIAKFEHGTIVGHS